MVLVGLNEHLSIWICLCCYSCNARTPYACSSEHGEPPRKTVQPQDIWLCLGLIIRELGVRYALPDKGWGLTVDGV
jgi:hypothetical protein